MLRRAALVNTETTMAQRHANRAERRPRHATQTRGLSAWVDAAYPTVEAHPDLEGPPWPSV